MTITLTNIRPYLIQRLLPPYTGELQKFRNPFQFGGGLKNGGLSDTAIDLLSPVMRFDYMGAAEFEYGALPECLAKIFKSAQDGDMVMGEITIKAKVVRYHPKKDLAPKKPVPMPVYYYCKREHEEDVKNIIQILSGSAKGDIRLKESDNMAWTIADILTNNVSDHNPSGWLDIGNNYAFFINKQMFEGFTQLMEQAIQSRQA